MSVPVLSRPSFKKKVSVGESGRLPNFSKKAEKQVEATMRNKLSKLPAEDLRAMPLGIKGRFPVLTKAEKVPTVKRIYGDIRTNDGMLEAEGGKLRGFAKRGFLYKAALWVKYLKELIVKFPPTDKKFSNWDCGDKNGATCLHFAAVLNHLPLAIYFLEQGANANAKTIFGETPLHLATRRHLAEMAAELVNRGADPHAKDTEGNTPVSLGLKDLLESEIKSKTQARKDRQSDITEVHRKLADVREKIAKKMKDAQDPELSTAGVPVGLAEILRTDITFNKAIPEAEEDSEKKVTNLVVRAPTVKTQNAQKRERKEKNKLFAMIEEGKLAKPVAVKRDWEDSTGEAMLTERAKSALERITKYMAEKTKAKQAKKANGKTDNKSKDEEKGNKRKRDESESESSTSESDSSDSESESESSSDSDSSDSESSDSSDSSSDSSDGESSDSSSSEAGDSDSVCSSCAEAEDMPISKKHNPNPSGTSLDDSSAPAEVGGYREDRSILEKIQKDLDAQPPHKELELRIYDPPVDHATIKFHTKVINFYINHKGVDRKLKEADLREDKRDFTSYGLLEARMVPKLKHEHVPKLGDDWKTNKFVEMRRKQKEEKEAQAGKPAEQEENKEEQ